MIFPIADDADGAAELAHHLALGHGGFGVVCAFAVDVGAELAQEVFDRGLVEDNNIVHGGERRNQFRARLGREDRPPGAFECARRGVAVDRRACRRRY